MKLRVLEWLACPQCEQSQFRIEYSKTESYAQWSAHQTETDTDDHTLDIIEGALHC